MKYRLTVQFVLILLLAMSLGGCGYISSLTAESMLKRGVEQLESNEPEEAVIQFTSIINSRTDASVQAQAYYYRGLAACNDFEQRYSDLSDAIRISRGKKLKSRASIAIGDLFFSEQQEYVRASDYYLLAYDFYNKLDAVQTPEELLYKLAVTLQYVGNWEQADRYLSELLSLYPDSEFADHAKERFSGRAFTIKIATVLTAEEAEQLSGQYSQNGLDCFIVPSYISGNIVYDVCLGRFNTYEQVEAQLADLTDAYSDAIISVVL